MKTPTLPAPAIAQGIKELKLVTSYPRDLPGSGTSPKRLAQSIAAMSDGHLKVTIYPGGSLVRALEVFDAVSAGAAEFVGPWKDIWLGLDKVADYYYYPGFHEPGFNGALGINKTLWDGLTASERALIEAAAQAEVTRSLAEFNSENIKSLKLLRDDQRIKIRRFNDELIKTFGKLSKEVLADTAAKDPLTRKVYDSYTAFLAGMMDWTELSERGYLDTRRLALA